jgi:hypothetical protein
MSAKKPQIVSCGLMASLLWQDLYWPDVIEYLSEEIPSILKKGIVSYQLPTFSKDETVKNEKSDNQNHFLKK